MYLRSYTGSFNTFPALNLKGYVTGVPIAPPSTCSTITIHKVTQNGDATFDYTTTGGLSPATFQLSNGGTRTYDQVPPGSYTVTEGALPAGWTFVSLVCTTTGADTATVTGTTVTITAVNAETTDCTYTNHTKLSPSIATLLVPAGPVALGDSVHDSATLSGATAGAGGSVTYAVFSDDTCSTAVTSGRHLLLAGLL